MIEADGAPCGRLSSLGPDAIQTGRCESVMANTNNIHLTRDDDRLDFLARVASMYYEEGLTQQTISARLGYSRSAISRFLSEARELGIVEINIHHPLTRSAPLEQQLQEEFKLKEVRVLVRGALAYSAMLHRLGALAAHIVEQVVHEDSILGVSWGTGVYEVANTLHPPHYPGVQVVQMIGALGTADPLIDGPELARWFARLYGGRYQTLPAPLIVESEAVRNGLMNDRRIREILTLAEQADIAVVGIGTTDPAMSSTVRAGYLTAEESNEMAAQGAVGDVCAIHFDIRGRILDLPIGRRTVGIEAEKLRRIPTVLGIAGGEIKAPAILGALRSGLINTLVTDDLTAREIIKLNNQFHL